MLFDKADYRPDYFSMGFTHTRAIFVNKCAVLSVCTVRFGLVNNISVMMV